MSKEDAHTSDAVFARDRPGTSAESTTIRIEHEHDSHPTGVQQDRLSTSITIDGAGANDVGSMNVGSMNGNETFGAARNFLLLFNEFGTRGRHSSSNVARVQLPDFRDSGIAAEGIGSRTHPASSSRQAQSSHARHIQSLRRNLNNVLSFSSAPSTEALRSLITHSSNFRYAPLPINENPGNTSGDNNLNNLLSSRNSVESAPTTEHRINALRAFRSNSVRDDNGMGQQAQHQQASEGGTGASTSLHSSATMSPSNIEGTSSSSPSSPSLNNNQNNENRQLGNRYNAPEINVDEENVFSDVVVKILSHFVRYLPFICIILIKCIHDHLLGILDLLILHGVLYQLNKSLREQVAKFSQKSYTILLRDLSVVIFVVTYRFVLATSTPDPFGLLISPPASETVLINTQNGDHPVDKKSIAMIDSRPTIAGNSIANNNNTEVATKVISLSMLLYYVAVNDLVLKLLTILVKILITMLPTSIIRHKPRARAYVLVEFFSQFYRALAPIHQWFLYLFESYSGLEVISGVLFSSFYVGAKFFELIERAKSLKKAFINFLRNTDYERKPTKDELDTAGSLCPICHDAYNAPVVLECGHIFCDDCVNTWFKREQTCPMCRAKVSDDPTWQDGSTTFFYQLC